ncbi:MAG: 4-(cytidine 5'-diphospho)-2-C-methyl-D-erythritol kinase [Sphingomonadaceae bacterium]
MGGRTTDRRALRLDCRPHSGRRRSSRAARAQDRAGAALILADTAYAKVNLALHVRRKRADGYHDLETVFAFCGDGDRLTVEPAESLSLTIDGPFAAALGDGSDNLVLRAAQAFGSVKGACLRLTKNLPVASGIGGGSADAAATLRLLSTLWQCPMPDLDTQLKLGADCPACVLSQTMRGEGVGEQLQGGPDVSGTPILLINPGVAVSTRDVFARWDGFDRGPLIDWRDGRNDLETAARALAPAIGNLLAWLNARYDVVTARMSGSGATCFALFETRVARDKVAREADTAFPGYWQLATLLR